MKSIPIGRVSKKVFQFQDGSIKWAVPLWGNLFLACFNSKMVRLNGCPPDATVVVHQSFNSKMVRLNVRLYISS